jgi:hypothetical protein
MAKSDCELLRILMKFKHPVKRRVIKKSTPVPSPIGDGTVEPIGNEDFVPITKKEYGFDWDNREALAGEDYMPE